MYYRRSGASRELWRLSFFAIVYEINDEILFNLSSFDCDKVAGVFFSLDVAAASVKNRRC